MNRNRILIVDDDKEFADGIAARCRDLGLVVETARNSLTAIGIIAVRSPDLICMDVEMPTGNGLSVCEFLASDPAAASKPIIILTGRTDKGTIRRCHELHAYYVHKSPQVWQSLRPVICELLDFHPNETESSDAESPDLARTVQW
jgi:CheY-like chemotaxis protein